MYQILIHDEKLITENKFQKNLVILLTGRGQSLEDILHSYMYNHKKCKFITFVAIQPIDEWYPVPKGVKNQEEAVKGLKTSVIKFNDLILSLEKEFNITKKNIALVGFSAGGVMAIQTAVASKEAYGAVVVHNGAILLPESLPLNEKDTSFLLIHNRDDDCFDWKERYIPMKEALEFKGYNCETRENQHGGHYMYKNDVDASLDFLYKQLNVK